MGSSTARSLALIGGRYALLSVVGQGALGTVYRSLDTVTDREVAVKVLHPELRDSQREIETLRREARVGTLVEHAHVMRVLDAGQDPEAHEFVVMELLTGRSLEHLLAEHDVPQLDWSLRVIDQVLAGLSGLHDAGIVHRDVKPDNIVLERMPTLNGIVDHVKLCDFGLAKLPRDPTKSACFESLTGTLCGTPEYIAPEQALGQPVTTAADIYSCGVILYQMTTGQLPFEGPSPMAVATQHVKQPPRPPSDFDWCIDPDLETVILKALGKRPADRFASADSMRAALQGLEDGRRRRARVRDGLRRRLPQYRPPRRSAPTGSGTRATSQNDDHDDQPTIRIEPKRQDPTEPIAPAGQHETALASYVADGEHTERLTRTVPARRRLSRTLIAGWTVAGTLAGVAAAILLHLLVR